MTDAADRDALRGGPTGDEPAIHRLDQLSRRAFFRFAGAGAAAAGLAACSSRPAREILPYAGRAPELTPGVAQYYASALVEDGFATGVVVASREGRPVKIEGNPDHPASLGATRASDQAQVMSLYDPERLRAITSGGAPAAWSAIERVLDDAAAHGGRGLHLVLEPTSSPRVIELVGRVRTALPAAQLTFWTPLSLGNQIAGNRLAFGRPVQTQLDLRAADVIVALDADLVADPPMALAHARQISDRRRVVDAGSTMSRLYVVEASPTPTGVIADHRLALRASEVERVALELYAELIRQGGRAAQPPGLAGLAGASGVRAFTAPPVRARWIAELARDLWRARGRSAIAAGDRQPPVVHALAAAINAVLGNLGRTVAFTEPVLFEAGQPAHDRSGLAGPTGLAAALARGDVTSLLVLGGDPVYTAPADLALAAAIGRVPASVYLGLYDNDTARACRHVVPALHDLERWDVARAYDGTLTPVQPLIEPLFGGRSVAGVLHRLLGDPPASAHQRMVDAWARLGLGAHGVTLDAALATGVVAGSALPHARVEPAWDAIGAAIAGAGMREPAPLELEVRPHPFVRDGRHTNNPWLLELPAPVTTLTWDNAAQISPATSARLGVTDGDLVVLATAAGAVEVPVIAVPGHADGAITLHTGFGQGGGERIARGIGASAFRLCAAGAGWFLPASVVPTGARRQLAMTQPAWSQRERPLALGVTLGALGDPEVRDELARHRGALPSLMADFPATGAQWAMSIDLTTCTGCSACVMACAAENNTPVVGRAQVLNARQMHWLRIDRYADRPAGDPGDDPDAVPVVQPMTCQHCERAPCEYVCPVEATTHSPDGLNEMTYNRCIGTRFCSNNCPYKVRRFNWFDLTERGLRVLGKNPDVTVRDRGVMEKCTYCVQRIRRAEIDARIADRPLAGDAVRTACQDACPTQAIAFGSLTDPGSSVVEHRARPHSYAVLHDQGTVPRTRYLARIRNPNPALAARRQR
ncbi:MAG TPA: 4Fe-4S dicluster domain-containing protein [Kofleriaceae bacterium]|nr:4Fe-4S dicluster domain-containing protein [Kofleriaceae bacterium]